MHSIAVYILSLSFAMTACAVGMPFNHQLLKYSYYEEELCQIKCLFYSPSTFLHNYGYSFQAKDLEMAIQKPWEQRYHLNREGQAAFLINGSYVSSTSVIATL